MFTKQDALDVRRSLVMAMKIASERTTNYAERVVLYEQQMPAIPVNERRAKQKQLEEARKQTLEYAAQLARILVAIRAVDVFKID